MSTSVLNNLKTKFEKKIFNHSTFDYFMFFLQFAKAKNSPIIRFFFYEVVFYTKIFGRCSATVAYYQMKLNFSGSRTFMFFYKDLLHN